MDPKFIKSTGKPLPLLFSSFARVGDIRGDGKLINLMQMDRWFKQARVIDAKRFTTVDTCIVFKKFKFDYGVRSSKISFPDFMLFIEELGHYKNTDPEIIKNRLKRSGFPGFTNVTKVCRKNSTLGQPRCLVHSSSRGKVCGYYESEAESDQIHSDLTSETDTDSDSDCCTYTPLNYELKINK